MVPIVVVILAAHCAALCLSAGAVACCRMRSLVQPDLPSADAGQADQRQGAHRRGQFDCGPGARAPYSPQTGDPGPEPPRAAGRPRPPPPPPPATAADLRPEPP